MYFTEVSVYDKLEKKKQNEVFNCREFGKHWSSIQAQKQADPGGPGVPDDVTGGAWPRGALLSGHGAELLLLDASVDIKRKAIALWRQSQRERPRAALRGLLGELGQLLRCISEVAGYALQRLSSARAVGVGLAQGLLLHKGVSE